MVLARQALGIIVISVNVCYIEGIVATSLLANARLQDRDRLPR
jgi:hypothetical protein